EGKIDLGEVTDINKISIGFFQASSSWVVFPKYVEFFTSSDGIEYQSAGKIDIPSSLRNPDWVQKDFFLDFKEVKGRYVKIFAKNLPELPPWHPEAGGKPWLMIDEIIVE
ncbi:MAG TPA: discoidin domain-containing protein, partial [Ignavibacteriaceae bacterium]